MNGPAARASGRPAASEDDAHLVEHRVDGRVLHAGGFLELRRDRVSLPDGSEASREYVVHPGAVAIVPLLDDGRVLLERQFRYPVGRVMLEIPAGKLEAGEPALACAVRELREETGYSAAEWAYAGPLHNAAAYSTEVIEIWFARGLSAGARRLDPGEFIELCPLHEAQLDELAASGALSDVKTLAGLMWLQKWRAGAWPLAWRRLSEPVPTIMRP